MMLVSAWLAPAVTMTLYWRQHTQVSSIAQHATHIAVVLSSLVRLVTCPLRAVALTSSLVQNRRMGVL